MTEKTGIASLFGRCQLPQHDPRVQAFPCGGEERHIPDARSPCPPCLSHHSGRWAGDFEGATRVKGDAKRAVSQLGRWDLDLGLGVGHCLPFPGAIHLMEKFKEVFLPLHSQQGPEAKARSAGILADTEPAPFSGI